MNPLNLSYVNHLAPYKVWTENEKDFLLTDDDQRLRNRLFIHWFNTYSQRDNYILKTVEVMDGNTTNFAAIIVQKSNPRVNAILCELDETVSMLQKKMIFIFFFGGMVNFSKIL